MFHLHLMKLAQHCLYNSGKGKYTRHICGNDMFILWNCISAIFYEDGIQNNQSLVNFT